MSQYFTKQILLLIYCAFVGLNKKKLSVLLTYGRIPCDIDNQHVGRLKILSKVRSRILLLSVVAFGPELVTSSYMYLAQILL
jgi:hypothetical protein